MALALLAAAGLLLTLVVQQRHDAGVDMHPVVLPDTLQGLVPVSAEKDFARTGDWHAQLTKSYGRHPFDGRAFGPTGDR